MNTMGKVLVFANLIFALITGGFLAADFATRTNWRQANDSLAAELAVARSNGDELHNTVKIVAEKLTKAEGRVKDLESQLDRARKDTEQKVKEAGDNARQTGLQMKSTEMTTTLASAELGRLREENKHLSKVIQEREQYIVKLNDERNKAQDRMHQAMAEAQAAQQRSETMLERVREAEKKLATLKVAGGPSGQPAPAAARNPNQPNPPAAYVRGKIEKVHAEDPSLVEMNVGSDSGVATGQTLDVYRLNPEPAYLGMVRIREVFPHHSIGRMVPAGVDGSRREVRKGDEVASSIQPPR
jgi:hypothetical protein